MSYPKYVDKFYVCLSVCRVSREREGSSWCTPADFSIFETGNPPGVFSPEEAEEKDIIFFLIYREIICIFSEYPFVSGLRGCEGGLEFQINK